MKTDDQKRLLVWLTVWAFVNIIQAAFSGIDPDEAYYWMYSRQLDWGYFDHPPMTALMIRLGSALLPGALGVRLFSVIFGVISAYLLWRLAGRPTEAGEQRRFFLLLGALPLFSVFGFIATPDSPLFFFTILFFFLYHRWLSSNHWLDALAWGASMAAMLYSKYHGILLIGFTVLADWRVFRRPSFYLAGIFGALLFFPHLYWQWVHDFPSVRYHLVERDDPYELKHTLTYLINQLVVFNPLLFPLLIQALIARPVAGEEHGQRLQRVFYVNMVGFWIFFFWTTFKGHVEPQWTGVLSIPLLLLAFWHARGSDSFARRLDRFVLAGALLILAIRLVVLLGLAPASFRQGPFMRALAEKAGNAPVLFIDSYRDPSLYAFYTQKPTYTYRTVDYRRNQYDIWQGENALHGRRVLGAHAIEWRCKECQVLKVGRKRKKLFWIDSFQAFQKVEIQIHSPLQYWNPGDSVRLEVEVCNPYPHAINFTVGNSPIRPVALFEPQLEKWEEVKARFEPGLRQLGPGEKWRGELSFTIPGKLKRLGYFGLGLKMGKLSPSPHSQFQNMEELK